jgi:flagellin
MLRTALLTKDVAVADPAGSTTTTATYFLLDAGAATGASGTEIKLDARRLRMRSTA